MKHREVFKAKKTNEYNLCCFYRVELSGDLPKFPSPHEPATRKMLKDFLLKVWALGHPNLVVAFARESATAICLLQELHSKDSLKCLPMEPKMDAGGKAIKKLSFWLLCMYSSSNDTIHEPHCVWALQCKLWVRAVPKRGVHYRAVTERPSEDLCRLPQGGPGQYPLLTTEGAYAHRSLTGLVVSSSPEFPGELSSEPAP